MSKQKQVLYFFMFFVYSYSAYADVGQMEAVGQCNGIILYGAKNYKIPATQFSQQVQKVIIKYGNKFLKVYGAVEKCANGKTDDQTYRACINKQSQSDKDLYNGALNGYNAASKTISLEHLKGIADLTCYGLE